MTSKPSTIALLIAGVFGPVIPVCGAERYSVTLLGIPAGGVRSSAVAVDDSGRVVGTVSAEPADPMMPWPKRPYLWAGATATDLFGAGDQYWGEATAIGGSGDIVGVASQPGGPYRAFLYRSGAPSLLGAIGDESMAYGVNRSGDVVGSFGTYSPSTDKFGQPVTIVTPHPVLWRNGTPIALPEPAADGNGTAIAINDSGLILVNSYDSADHPHAWLYDGQSLNSLAPAGVSAIAFAINNRSHVVGNQVTPSGTLPFFYADGSMTLLPMPPGAQRAGVFAINDSDQVVGFVAYGDYDDAKVVLWDDGTMYELNSLIEADSGWVLRGATAINNLGQIVGTGTYQGRDAAFLLTPVPEPVGGAMVSGVVVALMGRRRVRD